MRQDNRHEVPAEAGDLNSQVGKDGIARRVAEIDAAKATQILEGQDRGFPDPGVVVSLRLRGGGSGLESRLVASQAPLPPEDLGADLSGDGEFDLPPAEAVTEADLAAELVQDLERLREASDQIANTGEWLEQHSPETGPQEGGERVESPWGCRASATSSAMMRPGAAGRGEITVEKQDAVPEAEHQERVPMKITTGKRAAADISRRKGDADRPGSPEAAPGEPPPDGGEQSARMNDADAKEGTAQAATAKLEAELRNAQEALQRLRERAALQTRMYGSVGAQTRKLDQRASELRARVAKAQEALHERARKLQTALDRERERLRAYHAKLQQRAKELSEWTQERKAKLADEIAAQRTAIEVERAALARREQDLERRFEALSGTEQQGIEAVRAELEQTYQARLAEVERNAEVRSAELEAREGAILRREVEQSARLKAFEESRAAMEADLRARAAKLAESVQAERARLSQEIAERGKELEDAAGRREAELARSQEQSAAREQAIARDAQKVEELRQTLEAQGRDISKRAADLDRRDGELARISAAMEVRERRLHEWQARVEQTEGRLEAVRAELEEEVLAAQHSAEENQKQGEKIKVQLEELKGRRAEILRGREQVESRLKELEERKALLDQQAAEIEQSKRKFEEQAALITRERQQFADLTERSEEVERQRAELASRISEVFRQEEALKEREAAHQAEVEALERARKDLDAVRESLAAREREFENQEVGINERTARIEEFERRLQQKAQELAEERSELDGLRAEHADGVASLEKARDKIVKQQLLLDEAQLSLQIDRHHLDEREQALTEAQAALQRGRDRLTADQAALTSARSEMERLGAELARHQEETAAAKATVEAEHARLERDGVFLRDRERVLAEEKANFETARKETEELRRDLTRRVEEAEEFRRQLAEKAGHLKSRREQLAKDTAIVDERLRTLDAELAKVAEKDRELQRGRAQFDAERKQTAADRQQLEREREELEQARRTFQGGLRSLDESRRQIAEREAELGLRTHEMDELRRRLEDDRAELQRQRQEVLALQKERGDATSKVEALMAQTEAQHAELRRREELLEAQQQALGARAAELTRAEEELKRRQREHEALDLDLAAESEALEAKRKEFNSLMDSEKAALEASRKQLQSEVAAEQARLQDRARELEATIAAHAAVSAQDDVIAERPDTDQARTDLGVGLSERLAEVVRKEEAVETRCRLRLEELDRDIEQRLAKLEKEIRERREQAEHEIRERRRMQEDDLRIARSRLDEQVEELRRRQDAAAQEHSLLCQQRRELQEQWRQESLGDRPGEEPSFGAAAGPEGAEKPPESAVSDEVSPDRRHVESLADAESVEVCEQRGDRREELSAASSELVEDEAFPGHRLAQTTELIGATVGTETRRVPEEAAETASRTAPRRLGAKVVRIGALALLVGCGVGAVYLASTPEDIMVKGRVTLNSGAAAHLSAAEHSERMQDPAVFGKAAAISGADIQSMYRSGKIGLAVAAGGYELELNARVPRDQQSVAQACLDAWAKAYQEVLSQSVISGSERKARLAGMETDYQKLVAERRTAQAKLEELKAALQNDPSLGQVEAARAAKSELKTRLARARDEWEAAKAKLAAFEATAPSTDTIVPTEEQLVQACAGDGELMQAVEQRDAKARELHKVLTEAMSQSQTPLAALLASINELASEVDQQIADQTDKDIRRELEEIAVTLKDYRRYAEVFSRNWDELAPKVGSWKAGGDADLLLEYQKKAEMLIREFHSQSGESSKTAGAKTDAIAQGGSEMTMRRVIHGRLRKALLACQQARNDWILAARGAVPRYNLGLKALEDAIHDLTPRIEQRRKYHKDKLVEQLMKARGDERAAESQRLLENREEATRQYQRLSDEFVKLDTEATGDEAARAEAQQKQIQIREQEERISRLDREAQAIQQEIDRLQGDGDVSLAGSASYEQLAASPPDRLESRRLHQGLKLGGVSTAVSFIVFFAISGLRRPRH